MPLSALLCAAAAVEGASRDYSIDESSRFGGGRVSAASELFKDAAPTQPSFPCQIVSFENAAPNLAKHRLESHGSFDTGSSRAGHGGEMCAENSIDPKVADLQESGEPTLTLQVVQQPQRARVCGYNISDRRPIHPPPIVKLNGPPPCSTSSLVLFASLWSTDFQFDLSHSQKSHDGPSFRYTPTAASSGDTAQYSVEPTLGYNAKQVLMGTLVSVCSTLIGTDNDMGFYFVFPELAVRSSGRYRLKFDLYEMNFMHRLNSVPPIAMAFSEVFQVYSPKSFPGITKTTVLSKCLARQGLKIRLRSSVIPGDKTSESIESDSDDSNKEK